MDDNDDRGLHLADADIARLAVVPASVGPHQHGTAENPLCGFEGEREDPREKQADDGAEEALIPKAAWEASAVKEHPTPMAVMNLANALEIHLAIVEGRVRYKQQNYRLLSQFVGTGEIRRQFSMAA